MYKFFKQSLDEPHLIWVIDLECSYSYGQDSNMSYRRITGLLRNDGWRVNHKRVERIWRREGLKVPKKQHC